MEYKLHSYFCSPKKYREEYFFGNTIVKLISHGEKCADINFSVFRYFSCSECRE